MIFVTVGTHEQPFNRLIEEIDRLKQESVITDEVQMQTGYCTYEPKYCKWEAFFPYKKMQELVQKADIVITHGGPSSFIMPLQYGKIPIVVPRQAKYQEHINDHQRQIINNFYQEQYLLKFDEGDNLGKIISEAKDFVPRKFISNNQNFVKMIEKFIDEN